MWSYYCKFVLLILGIMKFGNGDNCLDVDSVVEHDKYMEHRVFRKFRSLSLYTCASECLMSSACMSFGLDKKTRTCLLNSNSSDTANVVDRTGFLFSDIQHWPKSISGRCAEKICNNTRCQLARLGLARCVPEFQGCGHPPEVRDANTTYDGHYQGAVATYSRYTCDPDYRACYNAVTSTCLSSGAWESLAGLCGQYRWYRPVEDIYSFPCGRSSKFRLIMNATPTKTTKWRMKIKKQADTLVFSEFRLSHNGESNVVVINTDIDGQWGTEERFGVAMAVGNTMEIQITLLDGVYRFEIDGASTHNFTERDPGATPDRFNFSGDVSVSMMELMP